MLTLDMLCSAQVSGEVRLLEQKIPGMAGAYLASCPSFGERPPPFPHKKGQRHA